jgi:hypothetical protein
MAGHKERAHSKFSASGAERWFACPGSVALSEGQPDKSNKYSDEGTWAHEVLEEMLSYSIMVGAPSVPADFKMGGKPPPREMLKLVRDAADFILGIHNDLPYSRVSAEERVYLDFIHPEMFGTYDGAVAHYGEILHVFDLKYGAGQAVFPENNLQAIFYALGVAHKHLWNFKQVRIWILQPRVSGFDGYLFWDVSIAELLSYVEVFKAAVARVEKHPNKYIEGSHCHWCKAKSICPLKDNKKLDKAREIFNISERRNTTNGIKKESSSPKESFKSEADWKAEARKKKSKGKRNSNCASQSF